MCIERQPIYTKGQNVKVNVGPLDSPRWMQGQVIDLSPESENRLRKVFEKVFRLKSIIVEVDEDNNTYYGKKIKVYRGTNTIKPDSVR